MKVQDLITRINGKPIQFRTDLEAVDFVEAIRPDDVVRITVRRASRALEFEIVAVEIPADRLLRWRLNRRLMKE